FVCSLSCCGDRPDALPLTTPRLVSLPPRRVRSRSELLRFPTAAGQQLGPVPILRLSNLQLAAYELVSCRYCRRPSALGPGVGPRFRRLWLSVRLRFRTAVDQQYGRVWSHSDVAPGHALSTFTSEGPFPAGAVCGDSRLHGHWP